MDSDAAVHPGRMGGAARHPARAAAAAGGGHRVTALYQAHALGLIRLAYLMLGERQAAEDVVQEAFAACTGAGRSCPIPAARCPMCGRRC